MATNSPDQEGKRGSAELLVGCRGDFVSTVEICSLTPSGSVSGFAAMGRVTGVEHA